MNSIKTILIFVIAANIYSQDFSDFKNIKWGQDKAQVEEIIGYKNVKQMSSEKQMYEDKDLFSTFYTDRYFGKYSYHTLFYFSSDGKLKLIDCDIDYPAGKVYNDEPFNDVKDYLYKTYGTPDVADTTDMVFMWKQPESTIELFFWEYKNKSKMKIGLCFYQPNALN